MIAEAVAALALVPHRAPAAQAGARLGTLAIPRIGVRSPIYEGTSRRVLARGLGHYEGTGLPGSPRTVAFAGHRVTHTRPFYGLDRVRRKDWILVRTSSRTYRYRVYAMRVVRPKSGLWVLNGRRAHRLVLTTCHPRGSARFRLVVFARQVARSRPSR
jgi:sortase A